MIEIIFEMLHLTEHYGKSEAIEIAKGKYALPKDWKELKEKAKRYKEWRKK
jgi:hypothetical protein